MTYRELRNEGRAVLRAADVPDSDYDADVLLQEAAGLDAGSLFMKLSEEVSEGLTDKYRNMITERAGRKPLQHIVGTAWFMGLPFSVCSDVLCPRQDTEVLVEAVLAEVGQSPKAGQSLQAGQGQSSLGDLPQEKRLQSDETAKRDVASSGKLLDLCTGSGCLAVSLAHLGSFESVVATDLSEAALAVARKNAAMNGCSIDFRQGDLFGPIGEEERFDIVVCNPPYIPSGELKDLMPEVRDNEPVLALDGGEDGLGFYKRLARDMDRFLVPGGAFFLECGAGQSSEVIALLKAAGSYEGFRVIYDLAGHDRVVTGRRKA